MKDKMQKKLLLFAASLVFLGFATPNVLLKSSTWITTKDYLFSLFSERIALDWTLHSAKTAGQYKAKITLPYREFVALTPLTPVLNYSLQLKAGELVLVQLNARPADVIPQLELRPVSTKKESLPFYITPEGSYRYEILESGDYTLSLRSQPDSLQDYVFNLSVLVQPLLLFPVKGRDDEAVIGFFGDSRDGGVRSHAGVDIKAPRGTPIVAVADGIVTKVTDGGRAGKQVWLKDDKLPYTYFYAHLDEQWVRPNQQLKAGDALGAVGDTGNAKGSTPHLHFEVRQQRNSLNPLPFLYQSDYKLLSIDANKDWVGTIGKTVTEENPLLASPQEDAETLEVLSDERYFQIIGATSDFFQVQLPEGQRGYVHRKQVKQAKRAVWIVQEEEDAA